MWSSGQQRLGIHCFVFFLIAIYPVNEEANSHPSVGRPGAHLNAEESYRYRVETVSKHLITPLVSFTEPTAANQFKETDGELIYRLPSQLQNIEDLISER